MSYRGSTNLMLDAKGRMTFPSRYRDGLRKHCDGHLVITLDINGEPCLRIYPLPEWEIISQEIMAPGSSAPELRLIQERFVGQAEDCELDANGRILLPQMLRARVGLDKRLVLVGLGNRFELWDETIWEERQSRSLKDLMQTEGGQHALKVLADLSL